MARSARSYRTALVPAAALATALATAAGALPAVAAPSAAASSAAASSAAAAPAAVAQAPTTVATGTLDNGAAWQAEVPAGWNGKVVLFAHGFRPGPANPAWDAGFAPTAQELIGRGYAVASSSYAGTGWALETAVQDQLDTLAAFEQRFGEADRVIAVGRSMGGLVTSLMAEVPGAGIDGAVSTCGLVGGGVALNNYQLDAAHAATELLLPGQDVQLTGFTAPGQADATIAALRAALEEARGSAEGRARIALVAALLHTPTELDGVDTEDPEALAAAQADLVLQTLPTVIERRHTIVEAAGGDSGWTAGVDYARVLRSSDQRHQVRHLYRLAGLDLAEDLGTLTRTADIAPDEDGLEWMLRTSTPTGELQVPVLATHTLVDLLAPVEYQEEYAETVRRAGEQSLFRQAFVDREGHCSFTVAENVAAVEAMDERLETGHWGSLARASSLQRSAESLGLDGAAFVHHHPDEFVGDRTWTGAP
ncbi:alpha/beta hydrolase family protein [Kocuria sp. CH-021]|uniref:alpha/beta hydrolase family protein n=1 Tax=Kocuria sp. CH-021 TaxID=3406735 RepID=UPI003C70634F